MRYAAIERLLPRFLSRHLLFVEARIDSAVRAFAASLPPGAAVLDAGAGESPYAPLFAGLRYVAVDLGIGDADWNYSRLDVRADLAALPFREQSFDACIHIVTLEHVPRPAEVLSEIARVLKPGSRLLIVAPQDWEIHQAPHDYYRYTRHGLGFLLGAAGLEIDSLEPLGGFFRLLQRRVLNALQFFHGVWFLLALLAAAPAALILPAFEFLDRRRDFTLGYICLARRRS